MSVARTRQVLLLLDVDDDLPAAEVWALLPEAEDRQVLFLRQFGAPRLDRRDQPDAPVDWAGLHGAVESLVKEARALVTSEGPVVHFYICGLAPLPVFFLLGRRLPSRAGQQTFVNRRRDGTWDILPVSPASETGCGSLTPWCPMSRPGDTRSSRCRARASMRIA